MTVATKSTKKRATIKRVAPNPPTKWIEGVSTMWVPDYREFVWCKVQGFEIDTCRRLGRGLTVGVDPGWANLGLALGYDRTIRAYQITVNSGDIPDYANQITYLRGLVRLLVMQEGLRMTHLGLGVETTSDGQTGLRLDRAVVEWSSMGQFGESKLAAARAAEIIGVSDAGLAVATAAPAEINKRVFGSAYHKAKEVWAAWLPKDAADAAATCILASSQEWKR